MGQVVKMSIYKAGRRYIHVHIENGERGEVAWEEERERERKKGRGERERERENTRKRSQLIHTILNLESCCTFI